MPLTKVLQYPQETTVLESLFKKVKKEAPTQIFSCEYCEIFILPVLKNICEQLLFDCFNDSLLHEHKGSWSRLYDGIRLQGASHRTSFLFLSWNIPS